MSLAIPGPFRNSKTAKTDADLEREVRAHHDGQPGIRFLVDTLSALHLAPHAVRTAAAFYKKFPASTVMNALEHRPDLRARVVQALTAGPPSLTRRMSPAVITAQIELLVERDIPTEERVVRAEDDRRLSVVELYLKYLDPVNLAAYLPAREIWAYESSGAWWQNASDATKRLMAAEIKSIRKHKILTDSELLDTIGDAVLERDLPADVRPPGRGAARRAAKDKVPFTDTDMFDSVRNADGTRDLVDSLVESVPLAHLRLLVTRAAEVLGLVDPAPVAADTTSPQAPGTAAAPTAPPGQETSLMETLAPTSQPPPAKRSENDATP